jgi:putative membrane protein
MSKVVSHWSADAVVLAAVGAAVVMHLLGMRATFAEAKRLARPRPAGAVTQAVAFYCGLCAVLVALVSPVAYWAGEYIWIRSLQDVLLALAAPSLIVLGAPWLPLARGAACLRRAKTSPGEPGTARSLARDGRRPDPAPLVRHWLAWPVIVAVVFNAGWIGWHLPGPYDAVQRHPAASAAEVLTYIGLGLAFWLQLIGSEPFAPRFPPMSRVMLVAGTLVSTSVLAMVLIFGAGILYPAYVGPAHHVLGVVADQQLGGAVLWAVALVPFGITAIALCIRWLAADESDALDAGLDRMLRRSASAWPSRPGFR